MQKDSCSRCAGGPSQCQIQDKIRCLKYVSEFFQDDNWLMYHYSVQIPGSSFRGYNCQSYKSWCLCYRHISKGAGEQIRNTISYDLYAMALMISIHCRWASQPENANYSNMCFSKKRQTNRLHTCIKGT